MVEAERAESARLWSKRSKRRVVSRDSAGSRFTDVEAVDVDMRAGRVLEGRRERM